MQISNKDFIDLLLKGLDKYKPQEKQRVMDVIECWEMMAEETDSLDEKHDISSLILHLVDDVLSGEI
jgi:hypothetical protein